MKKVLGSILLLVAIGAAVAAGLRCPYDGMPAFLTGRQVLINAVIHYEVKCANGHITYSTRLQ
jgi:hypothetical protein